jgi:adenylosuccinate lyase
MMMSTRLHTVSELTALSPLDGRYAGQGHDLRPYFSNYALMKYRVFVEISWFKLLFKENIIDRGSSI